MKRITTLLIIALGVILVGTMGCATLESLFVPQCSELTIHFPDGDTITYTLPPEFPEMDENELDYIPILYGYFVAARQFFGDDVYCIFLAAKDARIVGAAMKVDDQKTFWIYDSDGKRSDKPCTAEELDAHMAADMEKQHI